MRLSFCIRRFNAYFYYSNHFSPFTGFLTTMIRTIIQRQTRIAAPLRISMIRNRFYATDKFQERETASENKYIHDKEMAKIKALRDQLDKAQKQLDELEAKAKESKKDVASKDKK